MAPVSSADNSGITRQQGFIKGQSGNPNGRPRGSNNKKTLEIKQFAREVLLADDPQVYLQNVRLRILQGEAPHMEKYFAEFLWGRPKGDESEGGDYIFNISIVEYTQITHVAQESHGETIEVKPIVQKSLERDTERQTPAGVEVKAWEY